MGGGLWSLGHCVSCLLDQSDGQQFSGQFPLASPSRERSDCFLVSFPIARPSSHRPVPSPSENPNKPVPLGPLNPGANLSQDGGDSWHQAKIISASVQLSFHASSLGRSSATSPGCHLLAKERNEQGPVGVDCGHPGCRLQLQKDPGSIQDRSPLRGLRTPWL